MNSVKDKRAMMQGITFQTEREYESDFGEVFAASVGQVFDEDLSISGALNREGWGARREQVQDLIDQGSIDKEKYWARTSGKSWGIDYNAINRDFPDVPSDQQLEEERREILKQRREYAEDVKRRGSGMANFLGSATGYMLDPISIFTMPIAGATTAAKGLTAVGQSMLKLGAVEAANELAIQGMVYEHKMDIESPYSYQEAITNIATAATGAAILGGASQGIAEYVKSVSKAARDVDEFAAESLDRFAKSLKDNPFRKEGMSTEELVDADVKLVNVMEETRRTYNKTATKSEDYISPSPAPAAKGSAGREASITERMGIKRDYDADIARYKDMSGEAPKKAYEIDQDFTGIKIKEKVRVKETGQVVEVDADAQTLYRKATKRRQMLDKLEECLNA